MRIRYWKRILPLALGFLCLAVAAGVCSASTQTKKASGHRATRHHSTVKKTHSGRARTASLRRRHYYRRSRRYRGQRAPTAERISEIQTALAKDGSYAGSPNGKWDSATVEAMKKFQAGHGLKPTGKLDALSLQRLGLGSPTAGVAAPYPPTGTADASSSSESDSSGNTRQE